MTDTKLYPGMIVRAQSGFFGVETGEGLVVAKLRGRHTRGRQETDAAAVGDRVKVRLLADGTGVIEEI
ncbi:MAG: ribosome small subunit-dependent GTPase, partial [Anaerolineales bacterium]